MAVSIQYERPFSQSAHWARRLALFAFILFAATVLSHRFGPLTTPHFLALAGFAAALSGVAVLLAAVGLMRLWQVGAKGGKAAFSALLLAFAPLAAAGFVAQAYFNRPAIYDVTTDTAAPPPWLQEPAAGQDWLPPRRPVTAQERRVQLSAYPGLTGRRYDGALDRVFRGVRTVADENGVAITGERGVGNAIADLEDMAVDPRAAPAPGAEPADVPIPIMRPDAVPAQAGAGDDRDLLLQGTWRTTVTGLPFDLVIRLREEAETVLVDMRVASRYGPHDLGFGADFAERFLKALDAELLGIAGD